MRLLLRFSRPAWSVLEYFWYPLLFFISTPYFLRSLGPEKYGQWMLLVAAVGIGVTLSGGTGTATIKYVSASLGRAHPAEVQTTISRALGLALLAGAGLATLCFLVFWFGSEHFFSKVGGPLVVKMVAIVAALLVWLEQIDGVLTAALKGAELFGRAAQIEIGSRTAQILAAGVAIEIYDGALLQLYAAIAVTALARTAIKAWAVMRTFQLTNLVPRFFGAADLLTFAKWGWLQGAGALLFSVLDRLIVGALLGSVSLAYYAIATQVAQLVHGLSASAMAVVFPALSRQRESARAYSLVRPAVATIIVNLVMSGVVGALLLIFGRWVLDQWLGRDAAESSAEILQYLTIAFWILAVNVAPHFILLALGRVRLIAVTNIVAGLCSVSVMVLLTPLLGLSGVGLARVLYAVIALSALFPLIHYLRVTAGSAPAGSDVRGPTTSAL